VPVIHYNITFGYTSATIGRGDYEVNKGYVVALEGEKKIHND
jgi:hypothetical protein